MKKRYLLLIMFFIIVITITLCLNYKYFFITKHDKENFSTLPNTVENENTEEHNSNDSITREQMLEDFNFMITTIEENSPSWGVMERKKLTSTWERLKVQYRKEIITDDLDIMLFYNKLGRFLNNFPLGHLDVMSSVMYQIHYNHIIKSPYGVNYNDTWKNALLYDKTVDFYSKLSSGINNSSEVSALDVEKSDSQDITFFSPYKTEILEEGNIALLQIDSFLYPPNEEQKQELFNFYKSIGDYENLIIDITKNRGGNTTYWSESIVSPNLKKEMTYTDYVLYRDTPMIRSYYSKRIKEFQIDKSEVKSLFIHENAKDYDLLDIVLKLQDTYNPLYSKPLFKGKIWLLTSEQNYSASEAFANFCKQTGFATLVGKTTRGISNGGTPLFFSLPNSGIMVRFDAGYSLNPDGTSQFETGTEPDYVAQGNPLEECLRIIENQN